MTKPTLTPAAMVAMIDHTFLKPFGMPRDVEVLCEEARAWGFGAVIVTPPEVERCRSLLAGTRVKVGTVVGFPSGQHTPEVKEAEARDGLRRGAVELDMVLNVRALQAGALEVVRAEFEALARVCRAGGALSKVILETCYLTDDQKRLACRLAVEAGLDFVKTSTGLAAGGATVEDIRLMRAAVGQDMGVKASGGIRDLATAQAMIEAGATRIGTSSGVAIVKALQA